MHAGCVRLGGVAFDLSLWGRGGGGGAAGAGGGGVYMAHKERSQFATGNQFI